MRLRPLLLHALLSLALVANGIDGAMASVHAACAHDIVAVAEPAAEPPCHEDMDAGTSNAHGGMTDEGMPDDGMHHEGMHQSSTSQHAPASDDEGCGDCANDCQCACIAHGAAALMPSTLLLPVRIGIAYTPARPDTHTAPALPHPVRPPIG